MDITSIIAKQFVSFPADTTISEMIGKLKQTGKRAGLVFDGKKYLGLVSQKALLQTRIDPVTTKVSKFVQKTPVIEDHATVLETAYLMFQSNLELVPVQGEEGIMGVVNTLDLVQEAMELPEVQTLKVKDIRVLKIPPIGKNDQIASAMGIMHEEHIDHLPLVEAGKVYGIVSFQDIMKKYLQWPQRRPVGAKFTKQAGGSKSAASDMPHLPSLPVSSFSTNENLTTIQMDDSLTNALAQMVKGNVYNALVLDGADFVGLLTVKNILRYIGSLKIQPNFNVRFVGLKELSISDDLTDAIQKIVSNEAFKLQRQIHNEFNLTMHFKVYGAGGRREKYSVHLRIEYPGKLVTVDQNDWDLRSAVHETFANAKNALKKKFRGDSSRRKEYE